LTESLLDTIRENAKLGAAAVDAFLGGIEEYEDEPEVEPATVATCEDEIEEYVPAVEAPTLTEEEVEEAVHEAEETATEEEKATGFWRRIADFFKGLFEKKEV
jgi:hypothetical protein